MGTTSGSQDFEHPQAYVASCARLFKPQPEHQTAASRGKPRRRSPPITLGAPETIAVYERRVVNAIEAHNYYLANGKPPAFRTGAQRSKLEDAPAATKSTAKKPSGTAKLRAEHQPPAPERFEFDYPLSNGMAHISVPVRMSKRDIGRLTTVLSTLEEQPQLVERTAA